VLKLSAQKDNQSLKLLNKLFSFINFFEKKVLTKNSNKQKNIECKNQTLHKTILTVDFKYFYKYFLFSQFFVLCVFFDNFLLNISFPIITYGSNLGLSLINEYNPNK